MQRTHPRAAREPGGLHHLITLCAVLLVTSAIGPWDLERQVRDGDGPWRTVVYEGDGISHTAGPLGVVTIRRVGITLVFGLLPLLAGPNPLARSPEERRGTPG